MRKGFDVDLIRGEFPVLTPGRRKRPFRYFDSACVTLRPRSVVEAIREYYEGYPGCHGRVVYELGREVTSRYQAAHRACCDLIGARNPASIIFVRNTTEGINAVRRGLNLQPEEVEAAIEALRSILRHFRRRG